jgi:hypothetical protein
MNAKINIISRSVLVMEIINKGKQLLIIAIVIYMALNFASIILGFSIAKAIRFILACLISLFIYKGYNWARSIAVFSLSLTIKCDVNQDLRMLMGCGRVLGLSATAD